MKNKIKIVLCFIVIIGIFLILDSSKYEVKEYKITKNIKTLSDPVEIDYIKRIDINLDMNKARISSIYTYEELMSLFKDNWSFPDNSRLSKGNNNIYFKYCPDSNKCNKNETTRPSYNSQVDVNKYHWVNFEIYTRNCNGGADFCENDFDKDHLEDIEVYLNGELVPDAVVDSYNDYWHEVRIFIPMDTYKDAIVKEITVSSNSTAVQKGTTSLFTANVVYYGAGADRINWSVIGTSSDDTTISNSGLLSVGSDEEERYITVRATSEIDNTTYGEKIVEVINEPLSIKSVDIKEKDAVVVYGGRYNFNAKVIGTASHDILWTISGNNSENTLIDNDGLLTVGNDETANSILLTATSTFDNSKKDTVTVTLRKTEFIKKIEINYDTSNIIFSSKTTYNDVRSLLKSNWSLPKDSGYEIGNNNIWFHYCPTDERCTEYFVSGHDEFMLLDRYTFIDFEVFATPHGTNSTNPLYDFDSENLGDIEIWVNGEKRDDAFANNYNDAWRKVDINVPITVSDGKLSQTIEFNYTSYDVIYGSSSFKNYISNHIGDGEISYKSSDPDVATVDDDGNVTINNVGECTITVTASETDDYKKVSNSYTIKVNPLFINPNVSGYDEHTYYYSGNKITPDVVVKYNDNTLTIDDDYTISYGDNTDYGYGYIYLNPVKGSNYTFDENYSKSFYINKKTITKEDITINKSVYYDGTAKEPNVIITIDERTLVKDIDYTVDYSSNINVGTAYANIRGIGNYDGAPYITFQILETPQYTKGDMNKDGEISLPDVIKILKIYLSVEEPTEIDNIIGDMNDDGEIGLADVIMLLKVYLGV